jgi:carotenoid 1,2-hydratase
MTERRRYAVRRSAESLAIGPSRLDWRDGQLEVAFDEAATPGFSRLRGVVRLRPLALNTRAFDLDGRGRHIWRPIAPRARVEVVFDSGAAGWSGDGYFDTNAGDEPLEAAFASWDWSRAHVGAETVVFYDVVRRTDGPAHLAMRFGAEGGAWPVAPPPRLRLPDTGWRIQRRTRGETASPPRLIRTLEDTPFYARSALEGVYGGKPAQVVHESLSLDRLRSPIVRAMLPFRMPRIFW